MKENNVDHTILKTWQYWYSDGVNEIVFGGICLGLGLYFFLLTALAEIGWISQILSALFALILVGFVLATRWIVRAWKERMTFPRTGYVTYQRSKSPRRAWLALIVGATVAIAVFLLNAFAAPLAVIPLLTGLAFGFVWLFASLRVKIFRFYLLSGLSLLFGVIASLVEAQFNAGLMVFYALIGLTTIISGALTLRSYLKWAPQPAEAQDE